MSRVSRRGAEHRGPPRESAAVSRGSYVDETLFASPGPMRPSQGVSSITVIPSSEINRIRRALQPSEKGLDQVEKRKQLHELSKQRANNWSDSLQAIRRHKAQRLHDKRQAEEQKRIELDKMEAKIQAETRARVIARAQRLVEQEDERFKSFNSKLLLSDVMQEREKQIELSKKLKEWSQKREQAWQRMQDEALELAEKQEAEKAAAQMEKAKALAAMHKAQVEEFRQREAREKRELAAEGERLRRVAQQFVEEEKAHEARRRDILRANALATRDDNEELRAIREKEREREAREESEIKRYAAMKEKRERMQREREEEQFRRKQEHRQSLIDAQFRNLVDIQASEQERLEKQMREFEERAEREQQAKQQRQADDKKNVAQSRAMQTVRKKREQDRQLQDEREYRKQYQLRMQELAAESERERQQAFEEKKRIVEFNKSLAEERRKEHQADRELGVGVIKGTNEREAEQDSAFDKYVASKMEQWAIEGKSLRPMEEELRKMRKPAVKRRGNQVHDFPIYQTPPDDDDDDDDDAPVS